MTGAETLFVGTSAGLMGALWVLMALAVHVAR